MPKTGTSHGSLFIDNEWRGPIGNEYIENIDPSTEKLIGRFPRGRNADVDLACHAAHRALSGPWAEMTPFDRGRLLSKLADLIDENCEDLSRLERQDVGKPVDEARSDVTGVANCFRYNAGAADKLEGATIPLGPEYVDYTELEPIGVTAHIVPWNFPLGMAARSLAPALAAGCTAVLKPAEQSPSSALALAELTMQVGIPPGVLNVVTGYGSEAGEALVRHPLVRSVTFTGSVATGRRVYSAAAEGIKPVVLELGGKNPMIVFGDADIDRATTDALDASFGNSGQVCSSASRYLLHRDIKESFLELLEKKARGLSIGRPEDNPALGPLVSEEHYRKVSDYIERGKIDGAKLRFGGGRPEGLPTGYFVEPTVFEDVDPNLAIVREEIFGPVAVAIPFDDENVAVALANSLETGLVAGVYTRDISRALSISRRLDFGSVWINGWFLGGLQAPNGGEKDSGIGRERGLPGIRNYLRIKNIGIRL